MQIADGRRIGFASACIGISLLVTIYLFFVLYVGFFDKSLFTGFGSTCLALSAIGVVMLFPVDRLAARILLVVGLLLSCYWVLGIGSLWWKR